MPRMTGGEAIVDGLIRHGIDTMFGLPGVQTYGLFDALARNSNRIRLINARHEQTTAYMALGYSCATGRASAYSVVPGPGVLNTAAALATAWGVNAPVLCVTGQVPGPMIGRLRGQLHELKDQLTTMRTLVKHADRIDHPSEAPIKVARAFQEMLSGRRGPASIEMPWEQFAAAAEVTPIDPLPLHPNPVPDPERIAALARLVAAAKAPMIWVGGGALHAGAEILALAEKIGAPVVSFRAGRGIVDDSNPLGLTVPAALKLWPTTDLLIGIGTRLEVPAGRWSGPTEALAGGNETGSDRYRRVGDAPGQGRCADRRRRGGCHARIDRGRAAALRLRAGRKPSRARNGTRGSRCEQCSRKWRISRSSARCCRTMASFATR